MPARSKTSIYDQVLRISQGYFGPAAERFISRQVENHLHKSPQDLTVDDLVSLTDWIHAVVSLLTDDESIIEEYTSELQKLINKQAKQR